MFRLALIAVVTGLLVLPGPANAAEGSQKAVLVTGASSGIGRMTAERLAGAGYHVYAGARKDRDIEALNQIENITAVRLDVTVQEDIDAAVEFVEKQGRGLWGVVNNAGVNIIDPLIEADMSDLEFLFDVNVYGVFRVTKAFAPMIIESKGRIVNISSIAGTLSGGLTGYGMYVMSKHAIEAFSDQLAFEMAKLGVSVSSVAPGSFKSRIGDTRCKRMGENQAKKKYQYFGDEMAVYLERCQKRAAGDTTDSSPEPVPVAAAVEHALFADKPKEHYLVTGDMQESLLTIGKAMEEVANLNDSHEHSLGRDKLAEILDNEIAIVNGEQPRGMPGFYDQPAPSVDD